MLDFDFKELEMVREAFERFGARASHDISPLVTAADFIDRVSGRLLDHERRLDLIEAKLGIIIDEHEEILKRLEEIEAKMKEV